MKEHDSSTEKTYSPESGSLLWAHPINRTVAPLWDGGVCNLVPFCITRSLICHWNFRERCRAQMCLILSSDASRKGICWNYLDSWKWEVSFPDYLLLQSISREHWRAPQAVSHQDLSRRCLTPFKSGLRFVPQKAPWGWEEGDNNMGQKKKKKTKETLQISTLLSSLMSASLHADSHLV